MCGQNSSNLPDKIVSNFCNLQFVDPIPKTCMAGKVIGQSLLHYLNLWILTYQKLCVIYTLFHKL